MVYSYIPQIWYEFARQLPKKRVSLTDNGRTPAPRHKLKGAKQLNYLENDRSQIERDCVSGVVLEHIWVTFDLVTFKTIFRQVAAVVIFPKNTTSTNLSRHLSKFS